MSTSRSNLHAQACQILQAYLSQRFPEESARLQALQAQLQDPEGDAFNRAQMRGHITTSAFVLDPSTRQLLLIHHKTLQRWLQPGGHFEANEAADPLLASALREAREETGIEALQPHPEYLDPITGLALPLDIDSHAIPANPRKSEGAPLAPRLRLPAAGRQPSAVEPAAGRGPCRRLAAGACLGRVARSAFSNGGSQAGGARPRLSSPGSMPFA